MLRTKTFEELVDSLPNGLDDVFQGTDADETIKLAFLEWLFDYRLCSDNDNTFLRYFRRRFNNLYPRYLEQLRILTIRDNLDPYVTEYFQDLTNTNGENNDTRTTETVSEGENGSTETGTSENTTTRTPRVTTTNTLQETVVDDADTTVVGSTSLGKTGTDTVAINGTSSLAKTGTVTETDNGTNTVTKTGTETTEQDGTSQMLRTGTDSTVTTDERDTTVESRSDGFAIAYPESNLQSLDVDAFVDGGNRTIDYANSESIGLNKAVTNDDDEVHSTVTHNTADNGTTSNDSETTYNTTETARTTDTKTTTYNTSDDGITQNNQTTTHNTTDLGSSRDVTDYNNETTRNSTDTTTQSGNEITLAEGENSKTISATNSNTQTVTDEGLQTNTQTVKHEHKGRTESVADLIPRAVKAIINTNELMWFIDAMKVCFDCMDCY